MELAIAGAPIVRPEIKFDPIRSIEHHRSNIVTGKSFKNKSWLQRLIRKEIRRCSDDLQRHSKDARVKPVSQIELSH